MSEAKHTPGPWEVQESGSGMLSSTFITDPRGDIIASMMGPYRDNYDARLIAAAPEMLEALELVVSTYEAGGWPSATIVVAKAAIAKATGKEVKP